MNRVGLGDTSARIVVFIANRPPLQEYVSLQSMRAMSAAEVHEIGVKCGNHWRKIFNCYAKLIFDIDCQGFSRWQDYRDEALLQKGSATQLRFDGLLATKEGCISVICGRTYAQSLELPEDLLWLDEDFAVSKLQRVIVCPYFDYRQLSNVKVQRLSQLIQTLSAGD